MFKILIKNWSHLFHFAAFRIVERQKKQDRDEEVHSGPWDSAMGTVWSWVGRQVEVKEDLAPDWKTPRFYLLPPFSLKSVWVEKHWRYLDVTLDWLFHCQLDDEVEFHPHRSTCRHRRIQHLPAPPLHPPSAWTHRGCWSHCRVPHRRLVRRLSLCRCLCSDRSTYCMVVRMERETRRRQLPGPLFQIQRRRKQLRSQCLPVSLCPHFSAKLPSL